MYTATTKSRTVSAIVVGHGSAEEIGNMLGQLHGQTKPPEEIIIVACCCDITSFRADIKVLDIHRGDWGHLARDVGLRLATKDLVGFFNSDDTYEPEYIEKLSEPEEDLIYCDFRDGDRVIETYTSIGSITAGNFLVKRELAQSVGWKHRHYEADGQFVMDLVGTGASWKKVPGVWYTHR